MKKLFFPVLILMAIAFWALAVPEPRVSSGSGSGSDANAITNLEASFGIKTGRIGYAPATGTNTNTVSLGWQTRKAGETNMGNAALQTESPLRIIGSLVMPVTTNTALTVNVETNAVQGYTTNANFTVTFAGTALNGARGEYRVWNTGATNILLGWPGSYSVSQAAGITSIPIRSNSLARVYWTVIGGSNFVEVSNKDAYVLNLTNVTAGQVIKFLDAHTASNGADDNSGSNTAINDLGDATGAGTVALAGNAQTWTTTLDSSGNAVIIFSQTDADRANSTTLLRLQDADTVDAQAIYAEFLGDSTGVPTTDYLFSQTSFFVGLGIAIDFGAATTFEIPNGTADSTLGASGQMHLNETDEQLGIHSGSNGEISGEAAVSLIYTKSWTFDPDAVCDGAVDRLFLMWIMDEAPEGIIIDEWKLSFEADPTTELDADLKYADAMIGVANAVTVDALDTTNGAAAEDTDANINGGAAIPNGKALYIEFATAYSETTHQIMFQIWYHLEED